MSMFPENFDRLSPDAQDAWRMRLSPEQREAAIEWRQEQEVKRPHSTYRVSEPDSPQPAYVPAYQKGLVALTGAELLEREFPPREFLLSPILPSKGLAMLFAERGIGKTWVGLNIAHAAAGGGTYLRWQATRPCRAVYIDGEMPASTIQERYITIVEEAEFDAPKDNFRLVAADLQPDGLPDLADPTAQKFYDTVISDADLIIVDNLSTVCRALRENEADSWGPVQAWILKLRAAGKSVLLIHHAGKGGGQRGTSRKEDVLDTVISLKRPIDYNSSEGARFEVHYEKARGFWGEAATPFEARMSEGKWSVGEVRTDESIDAIRMLKDSGATVRDIAARLNIPRSTVSDRLKRGRE